MKTAHILRRSSSSLLLAGFLCLASVSEGFAQQVVHLPESQRDQPLSQRWQWAIDRSASDRAAGYWIGYSIDRLMGPRSFIGSFSTGEHDNESSLARLVYGRDTEPGPDGRWGDDPSVEKVVKEVAVLFYFDGRAADPGAIEVSNVSLAVDLRGRPMYWIGKAPHAPSVELIVARYGAITDPEVREKAISAVAMHQVKEPVIAFLIDVLESDETDDIRQHAAFWIGQHDDERGLAALRRAIGSDRSMDVREKAVFAVSQMELPAATALLIEMARSERQPAIREKAIFWLGQRASKQVSEVLQELVYDDGDSDVQKHAVFAISQFPEEAGLPILIDIAKTHPSLKVRKQAIFLLGNSDDPRAVETLIELARLNN